MTDRAPIPHIVLMDGTLATLGGPRSSHIATIRRLVRKAGPVRVHYARGVHWDSWGGVRAVITGQGIEDRIAEAYGWLASSWRPGDPIFVFGYSRGAFTARSLAGMIGRVGLLQPRHATQRNIRLAWRLYQRETTGAVLAGFMRRCHDHVPIDMLGVFDTVAALGLRLPVMWMLTEGRHRFHDHHLGGHVRFGAQALALDETRAVFQPILWDRAEAARLEQRWFRGCHPDIGGQLNGRRGVAAAGQHPAGLDARPGRGARPAAASGLARTVSLRCDGAVGGQLDGMGPGLPAPRAAHGRHRGRQPARLGAAALSRPGADGRRVAAGICAGDQG
ncbi:DUF2235 domain-containing protein, partial [Paracoccus sphaerophysae]|uniref:DUF2235 domain-containing protein n=1 Tax=Paracoccus sphaerophysae TaxID=690417 RepID=UPI001E5F504A